MKLQRNELKPSNKYYLPKHRSLELKHFCLQYNQWKKELHEISYIPQRSDVYVDSELSDNTSRIAEQRARLSRYVKLIEDAAQETDPFLAPYILKGVTKETTFESLDLLDNIPCGKSTYYDRRHKFFYILDKYR